MSQEYENILVPVDGSKQAELAFNKAVATAKRNGAHLDLLNVVDTRAISYNFAGMSDGSIAYQLVDKSKEYLDELLERAKNEEGFDNIDIHIRLGNPKTVVSFDFPRDHHNDLIMMGASGPFPGSTGDGWLSDLLCKAERPSGRAGGADRR